MYPVLPTALLAWIGKDLPGSHWGVLSYLQTMINCLFSWLLINQTVIIFIGVSYPAPISLQFESSAVSLHTTWRGLLMYIMLFQISTFKNDDSSADWYTFDELFTGMGDWATEVWKRRHTVFKRLFVLQYSYYWHSSAILGPSVSST